MHRLKLFVGLIGLLGAAFMASNSDAIPRGQRFTQFTSLNEGDTRVGISVDCSSSTWTSVLPVRATRRAAVIQMLPTAQSTVCLGTDTSAIGCNNSAYGVEIATSESYSESNTAVLYCRARERTERLKGIEHYDSGD